MKFDPSRGLLPLLLLLGAVGLPAQAPDFDALKRRTQEDWNRRKQAVSQDWKAKQAALEADWDAHLARVRERWADGMASSREERVDYGDDYGSRSVLRLADDDPSKPAGLRLEVQVPAGDPDAQARAAAELERRLADVLDPELADGHLAGQVADGRGGKLTAGSAPRVVSEKLATSPPKREVDPSGQAVLHYEIDLPLVPDHLAKRAGQWRPRVEEMAARWRLPADLVFGVIQTESFFNPLARSHVPAFGLMQLVPRYGGAEAWKMVKGREGQPDAEYLYDGERNIELGVAYLHKLRYEYYGGVTDDAKAELLIVCAYNTGPGNVNKALTSRGGGERLESGDKKGFKKPVEASSRFDAAIPVVERLDAAALKTKLLEDLPWEETVGYLTKVDERRRLYRSWGQ